MNIVFSNNGVFQHLSRGHFKTATHAALDGPFTPPPEPHHLLGRSSWAMANASKVAQNPKADESTPSRAEVQSEGMAWVDCTIRPGFIDVLPPPRCHSRDD